MRRKRVIVAGSLLVASCGPARPVDAPVIASEAPSSVAALTAALARDGLYHDHFVRRTLYTWTTPEQIAEIAKGKQLLIREDSPRGASYFEQVIYALAQHDDKLAKLLYTTTFAKMRFAWPVPWATRRGWPSSAKTSAESYGNELVRVTLRADAIVLGLSAATASFVARDLQDHDVPIAEALAHPERIGAVYFVSEAGTGTPRAKTTYREFVLCNEAMIESWSIGGDELGRELEREAMTLDALADYLRTKPSAHALTPAEVWPAHRGDDPERAFIATLAFANGWYAPDVDAMTVLAQTLRDTPKPSPLTVAVHATFPGAGTPRKPPTVVADPSSTFASPRGTH